MDIMVDHSRVGVNAESSRPEKFEVSTP